jgi:hypothetical protein
MDIVFKCPYCDQELEVEASGAGSTLECPACNNSITVPAASAEGVTAAPPPPEAGATGADPIASFHKDKHFSVPSHDGPAATLIQKAARPLEVAAKESDRKIRIRTVKHSDHVEVGKDKFDEKVSEFLDKVGQENIISINAISYSTVDVATKALQQDYGVLIVFKG